MKGVVYSVMGIVASCCIMKPGQPLVRFQRFGYHESRWVSSGSAIRGPFSARDGSLQDHGRVALAASPTAGNNRCQVISIQSLTRYVRKSGEV
jgi:hypothetical protein